MNNVLKVKTSIRVPTPGQVSAWLEEARRRGKAAIEFSGKVAPIDAVENWLKLQREADAAYPWKGRRKKAEVEFE